ncbi:probable cytochrome P450 12a5, mitochondrial [Haliotis cracherodii]|uniref:probable cytochrome P450 12a5, mitochondrial n=1 Tax=Haliotis cracherodii TaxID=6455 RepID=UPI0039E876F2
MMKLLNQPVMGLLRRQIGNPAAPQRTLRAAAWSDADIRDAKPFEEIPGPKGIYSLPIIGTMLHFKPFTNHTVETTHNLFNELLDKYGSLVRVQLGGWMVLVEDVADIEVVMKNEGKYPDRYVPPLHKIFCEKTGFQKGLAHLDGIEWQKLRSPVNPRMMRTKSAQYYLSAQNEVADELVSLIKNGEFKQDNILDLFFKYACESITVVAFNKRLGYLSTDVDQYPDKVQALKDIQTLFELLNASSAIPPFILKNFPLRIKRQYGEATARTVTQTQEYYEATMDDIKKRQAEGTLDLEENNFMLSLMTTDKMTVGQMGAIALDLFGAGTDSTARNLQMMLYILARNPDKQQKLYEEVMNVMGPSGPMTIKSLANMPYLLASLRESFRIQFPTPSGTQRFMPTEIVLQGYRIPAGTSVALMNQRTVKNKKYFPNPEEFRPERWLRDKDGKRSVDIPSAALLPFGFGPRQCLGKRFAEQEIYLAVSKLIQNFEVSLEPGHEDIEVLYRIFIGTKNPIRFVFKSR